MTGGEQAVSVVDGGELSCVMKLKRRVGRPTLDCRVSRGFN